MDLNKDGVIDFEEWKNGSSAALTENQVKVTETSCCSSGTAVGIADSINGLARSGLGTQNRSSSRGTTLPVFTKSSLRVEPFFQNLPSRTPWSATVPLSPVRG